MNLPRLHKYQNNPPASKKGWMLAALFFFVAQFAQAGQVTVRFNESQSRFKAGELASNMLRIVNGSGKNLAFYVSLGLPEGWTSIRSTDVMYRLDAGDSIFVPVKVAVGSHEEGNINYLVSASLVTQELVQFATASWYVQLEMESDWSASVSRTEAYFINNTDTTSFTLHVVNSGNSMEWYTVKLSPNNRLQVMNADLTAEVPLLFNLSLMPGSDTVMHFTARSAPASKEAYRDHYEEEYYGASGESYPLRIAVQSQPKGQVTGRTWKTTVDFHRNSNEVQFNRYNRTVLPLTMEMRMDNLFEQSTAMSLNLYGTARLSEGRSLSYRYQSFFSQQYYSEKAFKGNYHYLGYFTRKYFVEAGNITGWGNFGFTPSGRGARAEYSLGRHKIGALYIQNPELFDKITNRTAGLRHEYELKKLTLVNYYQQNWNDFNKMNGNLFVSGGNFRVTNKHLVYARGGVSNENYYGAATPFSKTGYGGSLNYSGSMRDFNLSVNANYGSKHYTGYRGITNINYAATYKQDKNHSWTFTNSYYRQNPEYFDATGMSANSYQSASDKYELRYSINSKANSYTLRGAYYDDNFLNIHYQTKGVGFDYHPGMKSDLRFLSSVFASYVKLPAYSIPEYFTAQVRTSLRYKTLTANVRYHYGPYQAYEHLRFATYRINHQSVFVNAYYGCWLLADKISAEPSLNYSYETLYKRSRLSLRPQVFYFSKSGWQFNMYGEYIFNSQKITSLDNSIKPYTSENPDQTSVYKDLVFGMGVKKQFGIPVSAKKYFTATITIFKDLNGNGRKDNNEEALENILVNIKPVDIDSTQTGRYAALSERGEEVVTDSKGRVILRNLPRGNYMLVARPLVENSGWFGGTEDVFILDKSKEIEIPFSHGVRIMGSISVDKSVFSSARNKNPDLSRIRVTAVDSSGKTWSVLTGEKGRFEMFVPAGEYRLSINQKAIGDDFQLDQNAIPVNLIGGMDATHVSFHLKEKERQIKVKKFNKDGTLEDDAQ